MFHGRCRREGCMDDRSAGPLCCGRCGGPAVAVRAARRQRFRAAVFARPGGGLSSAKAAPGSGAAGQAGPVTGASGAGHPGDSAAGPGSTGRFATVTGTLLDASPHILIVATTAGERRFALAAAAPIWRGGTANATELRPGERVVIRVATGRWDAADKVWAGIGRVV